LRGVSGAGEVKFEGTCARTGGGWKMGADAVY
jgi:hypothetical protein